MKPLDVNERHQAGTLPTNPFAVAVPFVVPLDEDQPIPMAATPEQERRDRERHERAAGGGSLPTPREARPPRARPAPAAEEPPPSWDGTGPNPYEDDLDAAEGEAVADLVDQARDARREEREIDAFHDRPKKPPQIPAGDGPTVEDPLRGLAQLARVALRGRENIRAKAREPIAYVWQDIAVLGTIILLAGGPSEGKTTLLFLVLVARMNLGNPVSVLGYGVAPAPVGQWVVLIEGEHGEASTCRKLMKSCALAGVDDSALDRVIIVARKAVRLGSPEWTEIERLAAAGLVSDIAIDTVARVAPGDANDEREQVAIYSILAQAIEGAPAGREPTVWGCAHTRKSTTGGLEDVSGSAQRTGQADTVLLVRGEKVGGQTVSSTVTFAKLREDPDDYPKPVTWAITGGAVRVIDGPIAMTDTGVPLETRIEGLLQTGPKTKTALSDALKRSRIDVDAAIGNLFTTKRIVSTTINVKGTDRKGFALRQGMSPRANATPDETDTTTDNPTT